MIRQQDLLGKSPPVSQSATEKRGNVVIEVVITDSALTSLTEPAAAVGAPLIAKSSLSVLELVSVVVLLVSFILLLFNIPMVVLGVLVCLLFLKVLLQWFIAK